MTNVGKYSKNKTTFINYIEWNLQVILLCICIGNWSTYEHLYKLSNEKWTNCQNTETDTDHIAQIARRFIEINDCSPINQREMEMHK